MVARRSTHLPSPIGWQLASSKRGILVTNRSIGEWMIWINISLSQSTFCLLSAIHNGLKNCTCLNVAWTDKDRRICHRSYQWGLFMPTTLETIKIVILPGQSTFTTGKKFIRVLLVSQVKSAFKSGACSERARPIGRCGYTIDAKCHEDISSVDGGS